MSTPNANPNPAPTPAFYEKPENREKARELITKLIKDEWTYTEIATYFQCLGCSPFFINRVVKPFYINTQ